MQQVDYKLVDSDPVGFLVAPETQQVFFSKHWEKQPAVFRATPGRVALFQGLCSFPAFINWLKQREKKAGPLTFGVDLNAARYRDGVRTTPNGEVCWTGGGFLLLGQWMNASVCMLGKPHMTGQ